jgi:hypothetical protein
MGIHRGGKWREHFVCYTGADLRDLSEDLLEEAMEMIQNSDWPGFDDLESVCVDERDGFHVVGTTSVNSDNEILFLTEQDRRQEGIATLMVQSLIFQIPDATMESVLSGDWSPPYSAVAGSEEGASFLHSLSHTFAWEAWALIEWSGFDEDKKMYLEDQKRIANIKRKRLYRAGHDPIWTGTGSYWAEDAITARKYGKGAAWHGAPSDKSPGQDVMAADIHYPSERLLDLRLEDDMITELFSLGFPMEIAEQHVMDNDWSLDQLCLRALRAKYDWVRKPIGDTNDIEWVHLADDKISGWYLMKPIPLIDNNYELSKKIYTWRDGSEAALVLHLGESDRVVEVVVRSGDNARDMTLQVYEVHRTFSVGYQDDPLSRMFEKKLRGLLLDMGASRPNENFPGMISDSERGSVFVPWPRWISEEVWANRVDAAKEHVYTSLPAVNHRKIFMGIPGFALVESLPPGETRADPRLWTGGWKAAWWGETTWSETLEGAVDAALEKNFVLSEARREQWEADNIERGVFVLPTPEEVEVFKILDEPLPIWWPFDQLLAWLRERP